ncbi:hypothetical protein IM40_09080 [Candidatus Paracaedimonas acanthamoebae]|nr:hypothetical protein IM40_09080 [Candidatus Paracaedimonas acanthamoebae]
MITSGFKPPYAPTLIPYLTVRDAQKALDFYQHAFGFKLANEPSRNEKGFIQHVEMQFYDALIMFAPEGAFEGPSKAPITNKVFPSITLYLYCGDVDSLCQQALNAGAQLIVKLNDGFWGDRFFQVTDPDGHSWSFATKLSS